MRTFNLEDEQTICKMYQEEGKTKTFIARYFHCRDEAISAVLKKYNIPTKKKGLSKNRLLKENFFETIDTEEKAYFLGLLFSDGSVVLGTNGRSPMISLQLKLSDIDIIQKLKDILHVDGDLIYDKREKKECVSVRFRNQKMADDLAKYGIVPNKTYVTKHLPEVSKELLPHFLRGLMDGDGSIYQESKSKRFRMDYCSYHQSICEDFRNLCNKFIDRPNTNVIANYGTAYHIRFNDQATVRQLATALYKDAKVSLARKQKLAELLFEDKNEEDIVYSDQ